MRDETEAAVKQHNARIGALIESAMPGAGAHFQASVAESKRAASKANAAFNEWWQAEGKRSCTVLLLRSDEGGDASERLCDATRLAWMSGALWGAGL